METNLTQKQSERLPTLYEVLNQQSAAPLDMWSFYTFLSQYPHAVVYLDFWTDVMAYLRLCKDYVRGIRETVTDSSKRDSGLLKGVLIGRSSADPNRESVSSSMLLEALMDDGYLDYKDSKRVSQFLKGETDSVRLSQLLNEWKNMNEGDPNVSELVDGIMKEQMAKDQKPKLTTKQLIANAQAIVNTYLISDQRSERYLHEIPAYLRNETRRLVLDEKRHDPEVFEPVKAIVYQFLEMDCFPKFLSCVALHNLHQEVDFTVAKSGPYRSRSPFSQWSTAARLALGLMWWLIAFWIGYTLIFLGYARGIRVVTIVPFFLGAYYIICGIYLIDIVYAFSGVTQTLISKKWLSQMNINTMLNDRSNSIYSQHDIPWWLTIFGGRSRLCKVRHPFARSLLIRRAMWCLFLILLITGVLTAIFSAVPARRI